MKKIAVILNMIFLCGTLCTAQKISKTTFDKWVDYANCKYTVAYIEFFRFDPSESKNIKSYDDNVKNKLTNVDINNPLSLNEIRSLLCENGWNNTYTKVSEKIDEKKNSFEGTEMEKSEAIKLLKLKPGSLLDKLKSTEEKLISELEKIKMDNVNTSPPETQKPNQTPEQPKSLPPAPLTEKNSNTGLWITLISTWIVLIVLIVLFVFFSKEYIKKALSSSLI